MNRSTLDIIHGIKSVSVGRNPHFAGATSAQPHYRLVSDDILHGRKMPYIVEIVPSERNEYKPLTIGAHPDIVCLVLEYGIDAQ